MELRQLEYFLAVAEELSFTRAAERLHMTQPPLSMQIRALENEIGTSLFERSSRRVHLTAAGEIFFASTLKLLSQLRENIDQARSAGAGEMGRLTLGFVPSATTDLLPPLLRAFRERFPRARLELHELRPEQQVQGLLAGSIDCGLFYLPLADEPPFGEPALAATPISLEPLIVALPSGHELASQPQIATSALAAEPFIMVSGHRGAGLRDAVQEQCRRGGFVPRVAQEAALNQTIVGLVASGAGVALLPASVGRLVQAGVTYRPFEGEPVQVRMGLVWRRDRVAPIVHGLVEIAGRLGISGFSEEQPHS